jgi:transcriptional regulator with XRE-family HTH domain
MGDEFFARLIKRRRDALGFSQARLAELVGRSPSTIRNWERGNSTPSERSDAVALAAVLGLDEREVLEGAGFLADGESAQETVEQGYASLAPEAPSPPPEAEEPVEAAAERERLSGVVEAEPRPTADDESGRRGDSDEDSGEVEVFDLGTPPPELHMPADSTEERRPARAAPPTVLEAAPVGEPSYLEDPEERQRYRVRAVATAAAVLTLLIILMWSFGRATDALGTLWDEFVGLLEV